MLSTFSLEYNLHLWKERVEIHRLVVCLCWENDLVDSSFGKWVWERYNWICRPCPWRDPSVFVCGTIPQWLIWPIRHSHEQTRRNIRCRSSIRGIENMTRYPIPGRGLNNSVSIIHRHTWAMILTSLFLADSSLSPCRRGTASGQPAGSEIRPWDLQMKSAKTSRGCNIG
jgi:hypothetical protein